MKIKMCLKESVVQLDMSGKKLDVSRITTTILIQILSSSKMIKMDWIEMELNKGQFIIETNVAGTTTSIGIWIKSP